MTKPMIPSSRLTAKESNVTKKVITSARTGTRIRLGFRRTDIPLPYNNRAGRSYTRPVRYNTVNASTSPCNYTFSRRGGEPDPGFAGGQRHLLCRFRAGHTIGNRSGAHDCRRAGLGGGSSQPKGILLRP